MEALISLLTMCLPRLQWVHGSGYARFKIVFIFSRKHVSVDFRVEQLIRDAGRVFKGDLVFQLMEANGREMHKKHRVREHAALL